MALPLPTMPDELQMKKVLVAAPFPPRLDGHHGGSRALGQLLMRLCARHSIGLAVLKAHDEQGVDETLRARCAFVEEVEIPPPGRSPAARLVYRARLRAALVRGVPTWAAERTANGFATRLEQLVRTWCPDVVQFDYRIMGQFLPAIPRSTPRLLVDLDPVSSDAQVASLLAPLEARAWSALGRSVSRQVDALVVLTEHDRATIEELDPAAPVACIPIGYDVPERPLNPVGTNGREIIYVGSFIHPPNVDAGLRLVQDIFPRVKARVPDATLRLVGSYASARVDAVSGDSVEVLHDVPDVRPYLDAAAVFAAPIRTGGGMRVKVLEALAHGKALVASPLAIEGLDVEGGKHVLVGTTDAEFADALVDLLLHPERRKAVATAGRAWAEENLDLEPLVRAYEELYASLTDRAGVSVRRAVLAPRRD
jgi:polysaccharide biosynthesis protein PslH